MILRGYYPPKVEMSNMTRPRVTVEWSDVTSWYLAIELGTPGSDPVWMIEWDWTMSTEEAAGWRGRVVDFLARVTP